MGGKINVMHHLTQQFRDTKEAGSKKYKHLKSKIEGMSLIQHHHQETCVWLFLYL